MTISKQILLALAPALVAGSYKDALRGSNPGPYQGEPQTEQDTDPDEDVVVVGAEARKADPTPAEALAIEEAKAAKANAEKMGFELVDNEWDSPDAKGTQKIHLF